MIGVSFANSWAWIFFAILLLMALLMWRTHKLRKIFSQNRIPKSLRPWKTFFWFLGTLSLCLAAMGPQWGQKENAIKTQGLDMCFALDLSKSMFVEDVGTSRLNQAKNLLNIFLPRLGGDRASLVGFAGSAFLISPLTIDKNSILSFLQFLDPESVSHEGTDLGSAIETCMESLGIQQETQPETLLGEAAKIVILITDGEETEEGLSKPLGIAKKFGVPVYSLAVGSSAGGAIPIRSNSGEIRNYVVDPVSGKKAHSKLQEAVLKKIAEETGGKVLYLQEGVSVWQELETALESFKRDSRSAGTQMALEHRFIFFLMIAFIFLFLDYLMPETSWNLKNFWKHLLKLPLIFFVLLPLQAKSQSIEDPRLYWKNRNAQKNLEKDNAFEAQKELQEGLELDSSNPGLRYNWATTQLHQKEWETAEKEFSKILKDTEGKKNLSKLRENSFYQLGLAQENQKKYDEALKNYYQSFQLSEKSTDNPLTKDESEKAISRLLKKKQDESGSGSGEGEGKGNEGDKDGKGKNQPKEGDDHKDQKREAKFKGNNINEEQARQILESVGTEEGQVQKRRVKEMSQGKPGENRSTKPW